MIISIGDEGEEKDGDDDDMRIWADDGNEGACRSIMFFLLDTDCLVSFSTFYAPFPRFVSFHRSAFPLSLPFQHTLPLSMSHICHTISYDILLLPKLNNGHVKVNQ
jgi:hypothetical protein